ncbi:hypothetical protein [Subtercola endophyticus]|uniref:hypothetical protein n=1 Tax=Subtercola endophyticus TaxID=2895559 RepID=UPI001E4C657F|nr:hypothetical protein [Subtercola endophyticus]UFS58010.1 hypothetical protein LQ955_13395 [Subtercola endophyticus]
MKPPSQLKLHWYESVEAQRRKYITLIAGMEIMHWVIVREDTQNEGPERSRRACIEMMIYELHQIEVFEAVFESRGAANDKRDIDMLGYLRATKTITKPFRIDHVRGMDEPLLWLPDIVCGAISEDMAGNHTHLDRLRQHTEVLRNTSR